MLNHIKRSVTFCVLIVTTWSTVSSQQKMPLAFEVASIKPNKSGVFGYGGGCRAADKKIGVADMLNVPLGRCRFVNIPVEYLIDTAYWVETTPASGHPPAVVGLPAWAKSERFDVETKTEDSSVTKAQFYEMLRTLLSERFHFEFHLVTKEVSGYRLIIAKGGHKLGTPKPDERRRFGGRGPQGEAISRNYPLTGLVSFLTRQLESPIENATELTGNYDFDLTFDPASTGRQFSGVAASEVPSKPSLFSALQEHLGLQLEKTRLPVVSYVVDRIQRPNVN